MTSRLSALLVWGLAGAAAVFWALRLFGSPSPVPAQATLAVPSTLLAGDLSRLLGAAPAAPGAPRPVVPDAAGRFQLTGVVATRTARDPDGAVAPGLALIAVDGKPPRAFRVGDALDGALVLQSVGLRSARIGSPGGAAELVLDLPPPTPAATGVPSGAVVPVSNTAPPATAQRAPIPPAVMSQPAPGAPPAFAPLVPGGYNLPSPIMPPMPGAPGSPTDGPVTDPRREANR